MDNEIESLYALLGIKLDDASVNDTVGKLIKTVQSKLNSSIYGGENGVITLPATLEGKFKNGKEINQEIKDAYAAIYKKAQQMADESVSLTLKDIEDFKAQIDKFGRKTAKYKGNDIIANANNNLRQTLSDYQNFVNDLRKEVNAQQKTQTKQAQKAKAQQKAKTKKSSYFDVSDEEINDAIAKENARQAKIKAWRDKQAEQLASKLDYRSGSIDLGKTNKKDAMASEYSEYSSQWARELAKTIKETYSKELTKHIFDKEFKSDQPKGRMSRKTTKEEYLNHLSTKAIMELGGLMGKVERGSEDVTFDQIVEAIGLIRTIFEENGKSMSVIAQSISTAVQSRYDQPQDTQPDYHGDGKKIYKKDNYGNRIGGIDAEEGTDRGVGVGHAQAQEYQKAINNLLKKMLGEVEDISKQEVQANKTSTKMTSSFEQYKAQAKNSKATADTKALAQEVKGEKSRDEKSYIQDVRESSREGTADTAEAQKNQQLIDETVDNANTGTDSEAGKNEVVKAIREIDKDKKPGKNQELPKEFAEIIYQLSQILKTAPNNNGKTQTNPLNNLNDVMCPCQDILNRIAESAKNIDVNVGNIVQELLSLGAKLPNNLPALIEGETAKDQPIEKEPITEKANYEKFHNEKLNREIEKERNTAFVTGAVDKYRSERADKQKMYEELFEKVDIADNLKNIQNSVKTALEIPGAVDVGANAEKMSNMSREQLKKIRAQRITTFGLADVDQNPTATGDLSRVQRVKTTYGWGKNQTNPFKDLKLSEGIEIDTQAITEALQTAIQKNMFNAQTGGWFKNLIGPPTLYLGQDSLEKSRAKADAANTIMSKIRDAAIDILQKIQNTQLDLQGMKESGQAVFKEDGTLDSEASDKAAITLFSNLEEQKLALKGVLADAGMVEEVVKNTGGDLTKILQQLGFAAPELADCNKIIKNINSGLDKNGKALKFQTRTAEILNYSFQLMGRSIGQMIKNWMAMMNPLNLIKRAFQDFTSYDVKWQRTMNVIKYNLRRIVRPFMEWIAQQLVNIIGLVNALMKGIGKAFGKNWDLFDQSAASAEQMREELEQAANVTASFDELHDIGTESSNNPPMDLMGDIYTPQWNDIYQNIENFGKKIGDVLAGIRKFTEGWNFWTWLAVIGGALIGLKVLKWLISLFGKGKNPLQSVADGLSFLEKAVGWALLIWAFTEFTKALTGFVECMKTADWEDIAKSLITLGGAFAELVGSIILLEWGSLGMDPKAMAGLAALVWVFGEFVKAIIPFIELMWSICDLNDEGKEFEILAGSLSMLALAFIDLIAGVAGMEKLTELIGLDWHNLFGLAAIVGVLDLFVSALVPFIECIASIPEGEKIETIVGTFGALITAFLALAGGVATLSRAFKTMDWKAIGQFAVITVIFDLFMATLVPFVNAIKDVPFETLAGGAILIAGAFISLGVAVGIMGKFFQGLSLGAFIELIALLAVMGGLIYVITEFAKALKDLSAEQIYAGLALLAGTIITVSVAIGVLAAVFTALVTSGVGAIAIVLLGALLGIFALIIDRMAEFVRALGEAGEGIKLILEGVQGCISEIGTAIQGIILTIGMAIMGIVISIANGISTIIQALADGINTVLTGLGTFIETIGNTIVTVISGVADAIATVLQPILDFIDGIIGKITDLAKTVAHEIGETIRTIVETVGKVITGIIDSIMNAIPNLLDAILRFCREIGPAIENSVDAILRSVTKLINFLISGVEYLLNTLFIDAVNGFLGGLPFGVGNGFKMSYIEISRFVPQYEQGTNYVPNDGLAYLHQGEAVVPKKYNTPYQPDNSGMSSAIDRLAQQVARISAKVEQGIPVKGQFVQRGSDLVATVEKANNRMKNNILNNKVYAR